MCEKDVSIISKEMANHLVKEYKNNDKKKRKYINNGVIRKISLTMASICEDEVAYLVANILGDNYKCIVDASLSQYDSKANKTKNYRPDILIIKNDKINKKNILVGIIEVKAQMGYCGVLNPDEFKNKINILKSLDDDKRIIKFSKNEYKYFNKDVKCFYEDMGMTEDNYYIKYEVANNLNLFIVNVLASNHPTNVNGTIDYFDNHSDDSVKFYCLYGMNDNYKEEKKDDDSNILWYSDLKDIYRFELDDSVKHGEYTIENISDNNKKEKFEYTITQNIRKKHGFSQFIKDLKRFYK